MWINLENSGGKGGTQIAVSVLGVSLWSVLSRSGYQKLFESEAKSLTNITFKGFNKYEITSLQRQSRMLKYFFEKVKS